jgi:hypothetical protein
MCRFLRFFAAWLICLLVLAHAPRIDAFETDQYDLPPEPLADLGDEVSDHIQQSVQDAFVALNLQIASDESCLRSPADANGKACSKDRASSELAYLRSNRALARAVYDRLGQGTVPFSKIESWMEGHKFQGHPARYRITFWKSPFFFWPVDSLTLSPTVNLYGYQFGIDKFGHIFQQGYTYYKIYTRALDDGMTPVEARQQAIRWGSNMEETFFGTLVTGVYSNGDLFGNYVGMRFYEGLTQEITIGQRKRPAIVLLKDGRWGFNSEARLRMVLLRPFISNHLNEALNPSIFTNVLGLRSYVRRTVSKRSCQRWFTVYPDLSRASLEETSDGLTTWYGEEYGFKNSEHLITIANTCFDEHGFPRNHEFIAKITRRGRAPAPTHNLHLVIDRGRTNE